jgi:hypothetical protein
VLPSSGGLMSVCKYTRITDFWLTAKIQQKTVYQSFKISHLNSGKLAALHRDTLVTDLTSG